MDFEHKQVDANGLSMHVTMAGSGPAVLMMHGFPGLGYSWRHQIRALAEAGYTAIAPDMRGYGRTDAPTEVEAYGRDKVVSDALGVLDALGIDEAVVSGHDFGATLAWDLPHWAPDRIRGVIGVSVPMMHRAPQRPSETYAAMAEEHFLHYDYFREPGMAEAEINPRTEEFLRRVFFALSGGFHYLDLWQQPSYGPDGRRLGYLDVLPETPELPWPWLTQQDLDVYVEGFGHGFTGGLNWYRANDLVWEQTAEFADDPITCPAVFVAGARDTVVEMFGAAGLESMRDLAPNLTDIHIIEGAGHFVQMEAAEEVNKIFLDFLAGLD
ncbi:alpha/beta fold hydrolase [Enemella sp. A6]|uniref:alpha/beta fold hydrolase n=1 Tax=Enemella sp. A6 TaxID=3440152 RepID=UPI003EBC1163